MLDMAGSAKLQLHAGLTNSGLRSGMVLLPIILQQEGHAAGELQHAGLHLRTICREHAMLSSLVSYVFSSAETVAVMASQQTCLHVEHSNIGAPAENEVPAVKTPPAAASPRRGMPATASSAAADDTVSRAMPAVQPSAASSSKGLPRNGEHHLLLILWPVCVPLAYAVTAVYLSQHNRLSSQDVAVEMEIA